MTDIKEESEVKKLTDEQLIAFKACVKEANGIALKIFFGYLFTGSILTIANIYLLKYLQLPDGFRFLIYFLTGILLYSSLRRAMIDLSDEFRIEASKILNNKN